MHYTDDFSSWNCQVSFVGCSRWFISTYHYGHKSSFSDTVFLTAKADSQFYNSQNFVYKQLKVQFSHQFLITGEQLILITA